jgi:small-conductance mechanosensitive channel
MVLDFISQISDFFSDISSLPVMSYTFLNNTIFNYIIALIVFFISLTVLRTVKYVLIRYLKKLCRKTKNDIDDMILKAIENVFRSPLYAFLSIYIAVSVLMIPEAVHTYLYYILVVVGTYYGVKFVATFIDYGTRKFIESNEKEKVDDSTIKLLNNLAKAFLWLIAALLILSNLGYNITTLVAGLGVGGIAIAFALQNILADIFASFSIHFDKPFKTGDFIIIGDDMGTVKKIGIKSTRITTLEGDELVVSNRDLTETRVHNYKRMRKRRVQFNINVDPSTPVKKLKKIPKIIEGIISKEKLVNFDRAHFKEFGDFSIIFQVVYYLGSSDYNKYMDVQQDINLKIKKAFDKERIKIAYPMQKLLLKK